MNASKIFEGTSIQFGSVVNSVAGKEEVNEFCGEVYKDAVGSYKQLVRIDVEKDENGLITSRTPVYKTFTGKNSGQWTLSEFLNLQNTSKGSAELASYCDLNGYTLKSLGDDAGEKLNSQINTQAALQTIQNFYDMYISPVGETDVKYRLGEVTGKAASGTTNNQTDEYGRLRTRSLYNTKIDYSEWLGSSLVPATEYYSVLWFPPFKPISIQSVSWKGTTTTKIDDATGLEVDANGYLLDSEGNRIKAQVESDGYIRYRVGGEVKYEQNVEGTPGAWYYFTSDGSTSSVNTMSMSDYLTQAKAKRQAELDEKNAELLEDEIEETEANDTRLPTGEEDKYYDTFDTEKFLAARSQFTYRAPGFKAINDNINLLQWVLEGVSGITSTFLTEWDISMYLQEGLISNSDGTLPNIITLTHRLAADNPNGYTDERVTAWGVLNCAVSKIYGDNKKTWAINAYPYSAWHTLYPDPTQYSGWLDKITSEDGTAVYVPNYYRYGKEGLQSFLNGTDRNYKRSDTVQNRLMFQDFEGAALSGWTGWDFKNKVWKAIYTSDDDGFSDVDLIFLQTSAGLYKKRDLIDAVQQVVYGVGGEGEEYDSDMTIAGNSGDGNNGSQYSFNDPEEGSGGNKYCPGSVFKGALTFLNMFKKKDSSKNAALSAANSMSNSSQGNTYGALQDSLGLVKQSTDGTAENESYLLGVEKSLLDNSNGLGVAQYSPALYGGPHSYYRSPKSYQSYYQENNLYLRNIPRVDRCPDDFEHDSFAGINWPEVTGKQDSYYYKGNEKWCSNVSSVVNGEHQAYEQSWSAGLSRLKYGIHHYSLAPAYLRVKVYRPVKCWWYKQYWRSGWGWGHWRRYNWQLGYPSKAWNGEQNHVYGNWWWQWYTESLSKVSGWYWHSAWNHSWYSYYWNRYHNISWYYRNGGRWTWYLQARYLAPTMNAWHYEWKHTYFKRYVLHSEPETEWKIVQCQHYYSYLANSKPGVWNSWVKSFSKLFGYSQPYERLYQNGASEDYELFIEGGGTYTGWSAWDEKYRQTISFWMTGKEHDIMTKIVDWGGGVGSHNKTMFLTRDRAGQPDCLFRVELYHLYKPVFYWCEHSKTYSSRKKKYWWERHNGWKHYVSVKLHTCDRFYAGLSKPSFTNYGSVSNGEGAWGASSPRSNGTLNSSIVKNSILKTHSYGSHAVSASNCRENRKSPYDLMEKLTGRSIPRYEPSRDSDAMIESYNGIQGKGIISDIPGLDFEANDSIEIFSDKCCSKNFHEKGTECYDDAFNEIKFPIFEVSGWSQKSEISYNDNTYRPAGNGFAIYKELTPPNWWHTMILNMSLRNTFYRGDTNGPSKETFDISSYNVDVNGLTPAQGCQLIADRGCTVKSGAGTFKIRVSDIKTYTTLQKYVTVTSSDGTQMVELHDIVKTVVLKNAWSAAYYYFTSYDIAPRFLYNLLATQSGYLEFAKDFICGRTTGSGGQKGDYILSFDYIREIMEGNSSTAGLISPRTYYLADPDKPLIKDPNGTIILDANGTKGSYCDEMYGYNPWIKIAREWFCNSKEVNAQKHQEIEDELDRRIATINTVWEEIQPYAALNMGSYSYNTMIASWKCLNNFVDMKNDEVTEEFLVAYLNVLYEARRYFINKRCNKQDGTLWMCRHLEKMVPQVIASAVASSANVDPTAYSKTTGKEQVAFYELNNTLAKKVGALKSRANGGDDTLDADRIKVVYVKVKYATYNDYIANLAKVKAGTLKKTDERIVPITPIAWVKKRDGSFKNKDSGDTLSEGEQWASNGYAYKKGKEKYAVKPTDGLYKLYSKEKHQDEDNISKKKQNPNANYTIHNYDEAAWNIDWSLMAEKETPQILFDYFGGVNTTKLKDLSATGALDPQALICGAKQSADYWIIPVQGKFPRKDGYKTQLTLEMCKITEGGMTEVETKDNPTVLIGAAAYAMWPIIEDQTDVIPNSGDLAQSLSGMGM